MNSTNKQILIDCDPGCDDVFALFWLLIHHHFHTTPLHVCAITTVGGNVTSNKTFLNAARICDLMGIPDITIGYADDLSNQEDASHIHGGDGIGGLGEFLPQPIITKDRKSFDVLVESIKIYGGNLIILATGPLTNLAQVESAYPGILQQVDKIIIMGGSFVGGNVTPTAEFNISFDPASAKVVFESGANIAIVPLDVTQSFVFSIQDLERITKAIHKKPLIQKFLKQLTEFEIKTTTHYRETSYQEGFFIHDAHTVGLLLYPHLYSGRMVDIMIEVDGSITKGQTIIDERNNPRIIGSTFVTQHVDKNRFLESMIEDLKQFNEM